ncbi:MAG: hypothetical protein Q8O10_10375 [candidate division Zixibacteria bacterium]|nr:hypothetical protein [candidate division Zixibacteria bacterium]
MQQLSRYITIRRRYVRSVNLERDLEVPDSIVGYIPTARALETTRRFLESFSSPRAVSAWTLTGVYGTGKSAFAHFLTALCSPTTERIHTNALQILREADSELCDSWTDKIPKEGLIRAVATAQRESIRTTIIKALLRGTQLFWQKKRGKKPGVLFELDKLRKKIGYGEKITDQKLIDIIQKVADSANNGILLIIDELGKSLESAALSQSVEDLYVLQQIAESFSTSGESRVFLFGLLHQSFADYAHGLSAAQRNEWAKIQGRFEDIPWIESPGQTIKVIGQAITNTTTNNLCSSIRKWSRIWLTVFKESNIFHGISSDNIASIYPFHPVAALALPILCSRYAQNDRTLFTFLASQEPHSFASFLNEYSFDNTKLPTLKLDRIYDYFIESAGMTISRRPNYQRWVEIQESILDAKHLDPDVFVALKTIGILNLISTSGPLRASLQLVAFALCDDPRNAKELSHWKKVVDVLVDKGFVTLRRQLDELRIWQGSDFDIEREIAEQTVTMTPSLSDLLNQHYPLAPVVARRHSYLTGTVRYFERQYFDRVANIKNSKCQEFESDGLICYWVGDKAELREVPAQTQDFRPLIVICARDLEALRLASNEYVALKRIQENAPQLRTDGVARNEVKQRLISAMRLLDQALSHSFDDSLTNFTYWIKGRQKKLD